MHCTKNAALVGVTSVLLSPIRAFAGTSIIPSGNIPGTNCNITSGRFGAACIPIFIGHLIQFVLGFVGAFCLINIMIGGYQIAYGSAVGDKEEGKNRVLWALIGLLVTMLSYGILSLIIGTLVL